MIVSLALLVLVIAAAVGWFASRRYRSTAVIAAWWLSAAGAVLLVIAGARGLAGAGSHVAVMDPQFGSIGLRVDTLAGLFLVISFGVAVPALLSAAHGQASRRPHLPAVVALVLICTAVIITADNLFLLIAAWEGLGFSFYLAVGYDRNREGRWHASILAVGFSKASGALLLVGGLLLWTQSHTLELAALGHDTHGAVASLGNALLILGFATKVGLLPMHLWIPDSYRAAAPLARAVLAGVAVNVGFYGLWRTLEIPPHPPEWLAGTVIVVGGAGALFGIGHAAVHARLLSLIAWSSVENAGLITAGYGMAMVGAAAHIPGITAAGLVAATAQVCAHALGKTLLFTAAADVDAAFETDDLDKLRGVMFSRPAAGIGLMIGAFTLAGLPLTAGFASEWLTLEALMQQFRVHQLGLQLPTAAAAALVALTIGVAGLTFVRLVGLTVFARPAASPRSGAPAAGIPYALGVGALAAACLGTALVAPLQIRMIASGLRSLVGDRGYTARTDGWVLQPIFSGFSALSPSWLWIIIPALVAALLLVTVAFSRRRLFTLRRVPAWTSGSAGVAHGRGYTSFALANPMRKVLAAILMTRHELRADEGDPRTVGVPAGAKVAQLGYVVDVVDVVQRYLYRPLFHVGRLAVAAAKQLQSGRLEMYMAYMLAALIAVLIVASVTS